MDILTPKYRRDPNAKVHSLYSGVAHGNRTVTAVVKPSLDRNRMETTKVYGPGLARGQGGRIGVLVLGGMETTLDEMEYILEARRQSKFVPRRNGGEIASMCRLLAVRRNEQIETAQKKLKDNPSLLRERKPRTVRLHLPVGYRYMNTSEPGLQVLARI